MVILVLGFANVFADGVSMGASNFLAKRSRKHYTSHQKRQLAQEIEDDPDAKLVDLTRHMAEQGIGEDEQQEMVGHLAGHKKAWLTALVASRADLIDEPGSPLAHGTATLAAFVSAGVFPLVPYVLRLPGDPFVFAAVVSGVALFAAGALRSPFTGQHWLRSGVEMLAVGSAAESVAYAVGLAGAAIAG